MFLFFLSSFRSWVYESASEERESLGLHWFSISRRDGEERGNERRESSGRCYKFHSYHAPTRIFLNAPFPPGPRDCSAHSCVSQQAQIRNILNTISALLAHHTSSSYAPDPSPDPLLLAVGVHQPLSPRLEVSDEAWEDLGRECGGWEWIDGEKEGGGRSEFGGTFFPPLIPPLRSRELERWFETLR